MRICGFFINGQFLNVSHLFSSDFLKLSKITYRTRANKGRSILEDAPLRNQAKTQFLCVFYVVI